LVSGWAWDGSDGWVASRWATAVQPMIERNIPWAFACGNHDIEADLTGHQIIALDRLYPLSLTQHGPENISGSTNYVLSIYGNDSDIATNLWIFDTGRHECNGYQGWGCMDLYQIDWYKSESFKFKSQNNGTPIPSFAFFHIPLQEVLHRCPFLITN
jgi:hypothetical protein